MGITTNLLLHKKVTRKARVKANAFIKFETRAGIEAALRDTVNLRLEGSPVKVSCLCLL